MKDAALRIRLPTDLNRQFLAICRAQDKPAAQVLREYMRSYVQRHKGLSDAMLATGIGMHGNSACIRVFAETA
jgi:hypothetical protein